MARIVDINLLQKIKRHGPSGTLDVSACFNCGNCTAVCPIAQDSGGFPRRVIRMAQVGMEAELLASEELWRCYACGECTQTCPRQADPAGFMAAARSYAVSRYDFTGLAGFANRSALGNLLVFAFFSTIFSLLLISRGDFGNPNLPLFTFLPGEWIHDIGVVLFAIVGLSALFGVASMTMRFWQLHRAQDVQLNLAVAPGAILAAISDALLHRRFRSCDSGGSDAEPLQPWYLRPWTVHLAVMSGFLAMLLATTLDFLLKPIGSPVPPWYPMRILGSVGGLVCLYGVSIMLMRRAKGGQAPYAKSSFSDWFFPSLLLLTVLTGLICEAIVYLPSPTRVGHIIFFVHVVLAMDLVAMLPLTKFAHVLYRTLALALYALRHAPAKLPASVGAEV